MAVPAVVPGGSPRLHTTPRLQFGHHSMEVWGRSEKQPSDQREKEGERKRESKSNIRREQWKWRERVKSSDGIGRKR